MRLIDADELKKATINNFDNLQVYFPKDFIEEIDNAPTVKRPQGEWITDNWSMYHCNCCMKEKQQLFHNFCSFCGADMKGGEKND